MRPLHHAIGIRAASAPLETLAAFTLLAAVAAHLFYAKCVGSAFWAENIWPKSPAYVFDGGEIFPLGDDRGTEGVWTLQLHRLKFHIPHTSIRTSAEEHDGQTLASSLPLLAEAWNASVIDTTVPYPLRLSAARRTRTAREADSSEKYSDEHWSIMASQKIGWQDVCAAATPQSCHPPLLVLSSPSDTRTPAVRAYSSASDSTHDPCNNDANTACTLTLNYFLNVTDPDTAETALRWADVAVTRRSFEQFRYRRFGGAFRHPVEFIHYAVGEHSEISLLTPETDKMLRSTASAASTTTLQSLLQILLHIVAHVLRVLELANSIEISIVAAAYTLAGITLVMPRFVTSLTSLSIVIMTMLSAGTAFAFGLITADALDIHAHPHLIIEAIPFLLIATGFNKATLLARSILLAFDERSSGQVCSPYETENIWCVRSGMEACSKRIMNAYALQLVSLALVAAFPVLGLSEFCIIAALILLYDMLLLFTLHPALLALKITVLRLRRQRDVASSTASTGIHRRKRSQSIVDHPDSWTLFLAYDSMGRAVEWLKKIALELIFGSSSEVPHDVATRYKQDDAWEEQVFDPSVARFKLLLGVAFLGIHIFTVLSTLSPGYSAPVSPSTTTRISPELRAVMDIARQTYSMAGHAVVIQVPDAISFVYANEPSREANVYARLVIVLQEIFFDFLGCLTTMLDGTDIVLARLVLLIIFVTLAVNIVVWRWYSRRPQPTHRPSTVRRCRIRPNAPPASLKKAPLAKASERPKPALDKSTLAEADDERLLALIEIGLLPAYSLERNLGDLPRAVRVRRKYIIRQSGKSASVLDELPYLHYDYSQIQGRNCENVIGYTAVPVGVAGPLVVDNSAIQIPMATTEGCLVASTSRGCKAVNTGGGVTTTITADAMTRAPVVRFPNVVHAAACKEWLDSDEGFAIVAKRFNGSSRFCRLQSINAVMVGRLMYIRFAASTGDAMGMNMVTQGAERALEAVGEYFDSMDIIALSGNFCTDKKPSAVNWIQGRGKSVIAEAVIPGHVVETVLKCTVARIVDLNTTKNLIGSAVAGTSAGGFNAHSANIVASIFLACGQDIAQVVGSSNCLTMMAAENDGQDLRISCTMPSIEVGTIGGGTQLPAQAACLDLLGVKYSLDGAPGLHAKQLARVVCAAVLAGELSLCASLAEGSLVKSHMRLNRATTVAMESAAPITEASSCQ